MRGGGDYASKYGIFPTQLYTQSVSLATGSCSLMDYAV